MTIDAGEHVGLAVSIARRYGRGVRDEEAVLEEALSALLRAARGFDPSRGTWGAFAAATVSLAVRGEAARQFREPRPEPLFRVTPSGEEIERSDLPTVPAPDGSGLMARRLWEELGRLDARSREVLVRRFGLDGEPATYREIGDAIGRCPERVRQLDAAAVRKLRRALSRRGR